MDLTNHFVPIRWVLFNNKNNLHGLCEVDGYTKENYRTMRGIIKIEEKDDLYIFTVQSGMKWACYKDRYGLEESKQHMLDGLEVIEKFNKEEYNGIY